MDTSLALLVVQGPTAIVDAEQIRRRTELTLGVRLACYILLEHDIVVCVSERVSESGTSSAPAIRCVLPQAQGSSGTNCRIAFALRREGSSRQTLPGTDLVGPDSALIATVQQAQPLSAHASMDLAARRPTNDGDFLIEFDSSTGAWTLAHGGSGLQPLYYKSSRDRTTMFAASTQLRALLPLFERRPALDHVAVSRFLCNGFFCEPETPVSGIRSLLPREVIRSEEGTWRLVGDTLSVGDPIPVDDRSTLDSGHARVRQKLIQVIDKQTANDTEVACLLSGGVDSSTVAAVAATVLGKTVHTYTLVFEDAAINEAEYAVAVARQIGSKHRAVLLKQGDFEGSLDWLLGSLDLPTTDGLNSLLITRAIGEAGHQSALVGVGSDELFGGHECMQRVPRALSLLRAANRLPRFARSSVRTATAALLGCTRDPWRPSHGLRGKIVALLDSVSDPLSVYLLSRRVLLPSAVARLRPSTEIDAFNVLPAAVMERIPDTLAAQSLLRQVSHFEQLVYLRNQLLRDLQSVSVGTGVDIRAPFVDEELVALVASLPPAEVFGGARPKQFLIDCVKDVLPREAYERPKLGFVLPIGQWLGGLVTSRIKQLSSSSELLEYLDLDMSAVEDILSDCAAARGRVFYTREWSLFVLLDWCSRNLLPADRT